MISYRYSPSSCSCWGELLKKAQGSIVSSRIGMKFGRNVLCTNTHRLAESGFRFDVILSKWQTGRYFTQKSTATWSLTSECILVTYAASASS